MVNLYDSITIISYIYIYALVIFLTIAYYYFMENDIFGEDVINVGKYSIAVTVNGITDGYEYIESDSTFEIKPLGLTIDATPSQSTTYNTQEQKIKYNVKLGDSILSNDQLLDILNDEMSINVRYSDETINAGTYTAYIEILDPKNRSNIYFTDDSTTEITFTINKLEVKITNSILEMNYSDSNRTWALISPILYENLNLTLIDGSAIPYEEFDYIVKGMNNGVYKYSSFTSYSNLPTTKNVAGSTYLVSVEVIGSIANNYTIVNSTILFKYKTAMIGSDYYTIEDAIKTGGTIILEGVASDTDYVETCFTSLDTTISGYNSEEYYTLDGKLRVPFADVDMDYHGSGGATSIGGKTNGCDSIEVAISNSVFSVLNIPTTISLSIVSTGQLIVGGLIASGSQIYNRGIILNNGTITNNGTIGAYGYIKGTGLINVETGKVIDVFRIFDWNGGGASAGLNSANILPINAYSVHNVSCKTKIFSGATYEAFWTIAFDNTLYHGYQRGDQNGNVIIIGPNGLFNLTSGYILKYATESQKTSTATKLSSITGSNQEKGQKDIVKIYGTCNDNSISLKISASGQSFTMATSTDMANAISYMDITIGNDKNGNVGNLTITSASYKFLPGTSLTIDDGATLNIGDNVKLLFYSVAAAISDEANRPSPFITSKGGHCIDRNDSTITVNGTLNINTTAYIGGKILTEGSTGQINLSGSALCPMTYVYKFTAGTLTDTANTATSYHESRLYVIRGSGSVLASAVDGATYYAKDNAWYSEKVSIVFDANGGTLSGTEVISNLSTGSTGYNITQANLSGTSATRAHYTFGGWYIDAECTVSALNQYIFTDTYLYAKWTPIEYDIIYSDVHYDTSTSGSMTNPSDNPRKFTIESNILLLDPTNSSYTFGGWYIDSACQNRITLVDGEMLVNLLVNGDVTIYALWYPADTDKYTINYVNTNTDVNCPTTYTFVIIDNDWSKVSLQSMNIYDTNNEKKLYFGGWYSTSDYQESSKVTTLSSTVFGTETELTLYAKWIDKYEVTLIYEDISISYYYYNQSFTLPSLDDIGVEMDYVVDNTSYISLYSMQWLIGQTYYNSGTAYTPTSNITCEAIISEAQYYKATLTSIDAQMVLTFTNGNAIKSKDDITLLNSYTYNNDGDSSTSDSIYIKLGTTVSFNFTYHDSSYNGYQITNTNGVSIADTYDDGGIFSKYNGTPPDPSSHTIQAYPYTIVVSSGDSSGSACIFGDAEILMADGSIKLARDIKLGDIVMTWSFEKGMYVATPVIFLETLKQTQTIKVTLFFDDGTSIEFANGQSYFDYDNRKFISMNPQNVSNYIGTNIMTYENGKVGNKKIIDYSLEVVTEDLYEIITAYDYSFIHDNVLSMEPFLLYMLPFEIDDNLKYNEEQMIIDIEKYGLYEYSEWAEYMTEEQFNLFNGAYIKVAVEKGYYTEEYLIEIIKRYVNSNNMG